MMHFTIVTSSLNTCEATGNPSYSYKSRNQMREIMWSKSSCCCCCFFLKEKRKQSNLLYLGKTHCTTEQVVVSLILQGSSLSLQCSTFTDMPRIAFTLQGVKTTKQDSNRCVVFRAIMHLLYKCPLSNFQTSKFCPQMFIRYGPLN